MATRAPGCGRFALSGGGARGYVRLADPASLWRAPKAPEAAGRPFTQPRLLDETLPIPACQVATLPDTGFVVGLVREAERGLLADELAMRRVWTLREDQLAPEWLVLRRHQGVGAGTSAKRQISYALSNAPADTPHARRAELNGLR